MVNISDGILIQTVQNLKEWPPNAGITQPIKIGNPKAMRKPNSLSIFFEIFFCIFNLIQIPLSIVH